MLCHWLFSSQFPFVYLLSRHALSLSLFLHLCYFEKQKECKRVSFISQLWIFKLDAKTRGSLWPRVICDCSVFLLNVWPNEVKSFLMRTMKSEKGMKEKRARDCINHSLYLLINWNGFVFLLGQTIKLNWILRGFTLSALFNVRLFVWLIHSSILFFSPFCLFLIILFHLIFNGIQFHWILNAKTFCGCSIQYNIKVYSVEKRKLIVFQWPSPVLKIWKSSLF